MSEQRKCDYCGATDLLLVPAAEAVEDWEVRPDEVDDEDLDEFWICQQYRGVNLCGWHELADLDDALEEHTRQIEWLVNHLGGDR